jgi:hypothetical protein
MENKEVLQKINTMFFWIASNPEALEGIRPDATVEAEFGDITVQGQSYTLAHHGKNSDNPCPCLAQIPRPLREGSHVGVSHFDLDTLGGILRLAGYLPGGGAYGSTVDKMFWRLVAEVDVRGYHHLDDILLEIQADTDNIGICMWVLRAYHAWCAWFEEHRYPLKHSEAVDCTGFIRDSAYFILNLLDGDKEAFRKGDEWLKKSREKV